MRSSQPLKTLRMVQVLLHLIELQPRANNYLINYLINELIDCNFVTRVPAAVKNIKRQHLVELKALANPPLLVKLTLECVCILLGEKVTGWGEIRKVIS